MMEISTEKDLGFVKSFKGGKKKTFCVNRSHLWY